MGQAGKAVQEYSGIVPLHSRKQVYVWARIVCLMKEKTRTRNWRRATDMMTKWMAVAWIFLLILLGAYTNARLCRSTVMNRGDLKIEMKKQKI
jgi:hypothetical protein